MSVVSIESWVRVRVLQKTSREDGCTLNPASRLKILTFVGWEDWKVATPPISTFKIQAWNWKGGKYSPGPYTCGYCCDRPQDFRTHRFNEHVLTRRVFGGIEPKPSGLESNALTTRLPTAYKVPAELRERFQQLQNLAQKYALLRPEVILSMNEFRSSSSR
ncbi:hypothetical protein TNCV_3158881 [Trichonephila clavipes]|nr:hypothetical protein TNCV_3158881 [Trichonephila clavipes]